MRARSAYSHHTFFINNNLIVSVMKRSVTIPTVVVGLTLCLFVLETIALVFFMVQSLSSEPGDDFDDICDCLDLSNTTSFCACGEPTVSENGCCNADKTCVDYCQAPRFQDLRKQKRQATLQQICECTDLQAAPHYCSCGEPESPDEEGCCDMHSGTCEDYCQMPEMVALREEKSQKILAEVCDCQSSEFNYCTCGPGRRGESGCCNKGYAGSCFVFCGF